MNDTDNEFVIQRLTEGVRILPTKVRKKRRKCKSLDENSLKKIHKYLAIHLVFINFVP